MMFLLTAEDNHQRIKSYSATVKGKISVLKIEVEYSDPDEFHWALRNLGQIEAAQKAAKVAKAKALKAPVERLKLPPPKGGEA